jgi:hypothetical protein
MKTRQQYMNGECSHREYFAQFVTPLITAEVLRSIGRDTIEKSIDEHRNDIPLERWDALAGHVGYSFSQPVNRFDAGPLFKEAGEPISLSTIVCTLKEAAKQIKEETARALTEGEE